MGAGTAQTGRAWSESELQALPDDGCLHEVVDGELVMSPKNNFQHEQICGRLRFALESFNRAHRLGAVFGSSMGCWMVGRNCRAPDVSFIPRARLLQLGFKPDTKTFFPGAPDLAVEVLSPGNSRAEMDARLADFCASGTQLAWIVDPEKRTVAVHHSPSEWRLLGTTGFLDGEPVLPGFLLLIADLFQAWDWEAERLFRAIPRFPRSDRAGETAESAELRGKAGETAAPIPG